MLKKYIRNFWAVATNERLQILRFSLFQWAKKITVVHRFEKELYIPNLYVSKEIHRIGTSSLQPEENGFIKSKSSKCVRNHV